MFSFVFYPPCSLHYLRQTDTLSFVNHFYIFGNSWWNPAVFDLATWEGKGASEFPLFYWLIAKLWHLTGQHDWYLRFFNGLLVLSGSVVFFDFLRKELQSTIAALGAILLTSSSVVFWFYMANYIPDATALGFLLLALGLWWKKGELSWGSSLLLLAAGLMKPTFLLVPLSFVAGRFIEMLWEEKSFKGALIDQKRNVLWFGSVLLGSFAWVFYVKWYNAEVNNVYFLFEPRPIWEFDPDTRKAVWEHLTNKDIYRRYGYDNVFHLYYFFGILQLFLFPWVEKRWYFTSLFATMGGFGYFFLFYDQFKQHDYYALALFPVVVIWCIVVFKAILRLPKAPWFTWGLSVYMLLAVYTNLKFTQEKLEERFSMYTDYYAQTEWNLQGISKSMDVLYLNKNDWFFVVGDQSINGALRLLGHHGWSRGEWNDETKNVFEVCRGYGAKYLLQIKKENFFDPERAQLLIATDKYRIFRLN